MTEFSNYIIPVLVGFVLIYGAVEGVDVFDAFIGGAKTGITTAFGLLPPLIALTTAVGMFTASGALDILCHALSPLAELLHIPAETIPLALIRPISGSGTLVVFQNILSSFGPDSLIGRTASVMLGSTETTFYTIAIYFGAIKMTKMRYTLVPALTADIVGFIMSALVVRLLFGG